MDRYQLSLEGFLNGNSVSLEAEMAVDLHALAMARAAQLGLESAQVMGISPMQSAETPADLPEPEAYNATISTQDAEEESSEWDFSEDEAAEDYSPTMGAQEGEASPTSAPFGAPAHVEASGDNEYVPMARATVPVSPGSLS